MANLLDVLRSEGGKLRAHLREVRTEWERALRRREELTTMPLPPKDLAELLCSRADRLGAEFPKFLLERTRFLFNKPLIDADFSGLQSVNLLIPGHGSNAPSTQQIEMAIAWFFPEEVKAGIRRAFEGQNYSHGEPKAERVTELEALERKIVGLEAEERQIAAEVEGLRRELEA